MANETTTTTLDDLTHTSLIQPIIIQALSEKPGLDRFCRQVDISGQATNAAKFPVIHSYWGSPNDDGAGVATAMDGAEATALSYTAFSTDGVTATAGEYGVAHMLTDAVTESSVRGIDILNIIQTLMLRVLGLAMDDDYLANYANLSQVIGSTGVDLSVVNMIAAFQGLRTDGVDADMTCYVLDNQQAADLENAIVATSTSMAVFALSADRVIGYDATNYLQSRMIGTFRGQPVYCSGITDTANAGADVNGALICPTTSYNDESGATTHAKAWKRLPRFESQRQALKRGTDLVMTAKAGYAELQDRSGRLIQTDA